ncbi:MAG: redoxin domain-containing protein [Candidatus Eremiobacteraeota bacterium]|nr:redoxin domain-containing protein [Candidatus Eremiobacteraeota bacterium]
MQLVQLQQSLPDFQQRGLGVAALSYDSPAILAEFAQRKGIQFPLLPDPESNYLKAIGLRNDEATGLGKGVAIPAILYLNPQGIVQEVFFEESYRDRPTPASVLGSLFPDTLSATTQVSAAGAEVRLSQSDSRVTLGSRFTLTVELDLPEGLHAYAPDAQDAVGVALDFTQEPELVVESVDYPPGHSLEVFGQQMPVYEGKVRLRATVKIDSQGEWRKSLKEPRPLTIKAGLTLQTCTDQVCHPPAQVPLEWTVELVPLDLERSPDELQHKP